MIYLFATLAFLVMFTTFSFITAWAAMWAWNLLAPLWHGPALNLWQALAGVVLLAMVGNAFRPKVTTKGKS